MLEIIFSVDAVYQSLSTLILNKLEYNPLGLIGKHNRI